MSDSALARALALVRDLRARCPWDRAQTPQTLRPYLVEEVLELDQALKHDAAAALRDELGDLLLHLAFQIVIGEERKTLDAESVTRALEEKMWRRHPQLFGHAETPDHDAWERAKQRERGEGRGTLRGLARSQASWSGVSACPKSCGCRRHIFSSSARVTDSASNVLRSSPMTIWNARWSSRSPSSSRRAAAASCF